MEPRVVHCSARVATVRAEPQSGKFQSHDDSFTRAGRDPGTLRALPEIKIDQFRFHRINMVHFNRQPDFLRAKKSRLLL